MNLKALVRKESAVVKKRKRRDMQRSVCSAINKTFAENAALSFLADNESFSGYQRKRLAQSFEQQVETPRPKKRHISNSFLEQYKDIVMEKVRQWPANRTLNWSEIGRQCGLTEKNMGQKIKEVAEMSGIDLSQYSEMKSSIS